MTTVARTFASLPKVYATDTWERIVQLIAPDPRSAARTELAAVAGVMCSCITDEALRDDALTVFGSGPRVRIYCVYGDDAMDGDKVQDSPLSFVATDGDWRMSVPCLTEDLDWVSKALAVNSKRVTARATGTDVNNDSFDSKSVLQPKSERITHARSAFRIDEDALRRG
ncbi:MAG TPA: hypothetical protein VEB19_01500 [Gemmatimonadaceae bacterium]|nr:hypothetical protein [Gemmatimonadaceae bacterium]